ncbi:MAG: hypothetical protein GY811_13070 [Myxococcales bacterium]|nr:hypothetical protein [Myxococcales bacterium]
MSLLGEELHTQSDGELVEGAVLRPTSVLLVEQLLAPQPDVAFVLLVLDRECHL